MIKDNVQEIRYAYRDKIAITGLGQKMQEFIYICLNAYKAQIHQASGIYK